MTQRALRISLYVTWQGTAHRTGGRILCAAAPCHGAVFVEINILNQRITGRATATLAAAALLFTAGCADMSETQRGTAAGAGIGAAAGAVLGSATGNRAGGSAVVGGMIGAVVGNLWSKRMEDRKKAMEQATQGTGIEVSRTAEIGRASCRERVCLAV